MPQWQRVLGIFQLLGGIACLAGGIRELSFHPHTFSVNLGAGSVVAGALAAITGSLVLLREPFGLWLSFLIQAAQVVSYNVGWYYLYLTGPKIVWVVHNLGTGVLLGASGLFGFGTTTGSRAFFPAEGATAQWRLVWSWDPTSPPHWVLGINLIALYFVRKLWRELEALANTKGAAA